MDDVTRRSLLHGAGAAAVAVGIVQEAQARTQEFGPTDPFDLIVRGGEVVDPSQNLRGKRDVGRPRQPGCCGVPVLRSAISPDFRNSMRRLSCSPGAIPESASPTHLSRVLSSRSQSVSSQNHLASRPRGLGHRGSVAIIL
jgi:hypothetical protein